MVEAVAKRIKEEKQAAARCQIDFGEPFRWLLHGGPGTGKSHVIRVLKDRLFKEVLHWDLGIGFQIVALQAVMADLLGGDTIHHACGIPVYKRTQNKQTDEQKTIDIAKRVLQWRWFIIDVISMVATAFTALVPSVMV